MNEYDPQECSYLWTNSEIEAIFKMQETFGTCWSSMAKRLKSKTENQIKNQFYSIINRNIRRFNKDKQEHEKIYMISINIIENKEIRDILTAKKDIKKDHFSNVFLSQEALNVIHNQAKKVKRPKIPNNQIPKIIDLCSSKVNIEEYQNFDTSGEDFNEEYFLKIV